MDQEETGLRWYEKLVLLAGLIFFIFMIYTFFTGCDYYKFFGTGEEMYACKIAENDMGVTPYEPNYTPPERNYSSVQCCRNDSSLFG